ncbi:hypothetical protein Leryth_017127 [Lithospermum erythrorhizon]|nr:hypothetical protein Leryth_017127 [Lithospermum erythrorhizon]
MAMFISTRLLRFCTSSQCTGTASIANALRYCLNSTEFFAFPKLPDDVDSPGTKVEFLHSAHISYRLVVNHCSWKKFKTRCEALTISSSLCFVFLLTCTH